MIVWGNTLSRSQTIISPSIGSGNEARHQQHCDEYSDCYRSCLLRAASDKSRAPVEQGERTTLLQFPLAADKE